MKIDYEKIVEITWARLAAYIDGEGCISINRNTRRRPKREVLHISITVSNTNPRLIVWLLENFGGSTWTDHRRRKNPKWSEAVYWNVASRQAHDILVRCRPYFVLKGDQADIALAFQSTIRRWGVKGKSQRALEQQYKLRDTLSELKGTSSRRKDLPRVH